MKTTKADFNAYKKHCLFWIEKLGIKNYSIHFDHRLEESMHARTYWNLGDGIALIVLSTEWDELRPKTDKELKRLALHEVMHILLAPLVNCAMDRYTTADAIETAEHSVIRQLENIIV